MSLLAAVLLLATGVSARIADPFARWSHQDMPAVTALVVAEGSAFVSHRLALDVIDAASGARQGAMRAVAAGDRLEACGGAAFVLGSQGALTRLRKDGIAWTGKSPVKGGFSLACASGAAVRAYDDGTIEGLSLADGRRLWLLALKPGRSKLVALGKRVFIAGSGELAALDAATGKILRRETMANPLHLTAGGSFIAAAYAGRLAGIDPETLKPRWSAKPAGAPTAPIAAIDGLILLPTSAGTLQAFRSEDGRPLWEYFVGGSLLLRPVTGEGAIFLAADGDFLYSVGLDGRELWRHQSGPFAAAPVFADGSLYAANFKGQVFSFIQRSAGKDLAAPGGGIAAADPQASQTRLNTFLVEREIRRLVDEISGVDLDEPQRKPILAVLAFEDAARKRNALSLSVTDMVIDSLMASPKYVLVERPKLDKILAELTLSQSSYVDPKTALRVGKLAAANRVITGLVTSSGAFYRVNARMIETETGRVVSSSSVDIRRSLVENP